VPARCARGPGPQARGAARARKRERRGASPGPARILNTHAFDTRAWALVGGREQAVLGVNLSMPAFFEVGGRAERPGREGSR